MPKLGRLGDEALVVDSYGIKTVSIMYNHSEIFPFWFLFELVNGGHITLPIETTYRGGNPDDVELSCVYPRFMEMPMEGDIFWTPLSNFPKSVQRAFWNAFKWDEGRKTEKQYKKSF